MADDEMVERVARAIHFRGGDQGDDAWNHCQYWLRDVAREQARAAMAQIEVASPWQPIETAPRDGTPILVFYGERIGMDRYYVRYWDRGDWATDKEGWVDHWRQIRPEQPTHWMPLPMPPK